MSILESIIVLNYSNVCISCRMLTNIQFQMSNYLNKGIYFS